MCLACGTYIKGNHAEVSYCFAEEHMCNGADGDFIGQRRKLFLECISVIANELYVSEEEEDGPFNHLNIEMALDQVLRKHNQTSNSNQSNDDIE